MKGYFVEDQQAREDISGRLTNIVLVIPDALASDPDELCHVRCAQVPTGAAQLLMINANVLIVLHSGETVPVTGIPVNLI